MIKVSARLSSRWEGLLRLSLSTRLHPPLPSVLPEHLFLISLHPSYPSYLFTLFSFLPSRPPLHLLCISFYYFLLLFYYTLVFFSPRLHTCPFLSPEVPSSFTCLPSLLLLFYLLPWHPHPFPFLIFLP